MWGLPCIWPYFVFAHFTVKCRTWALCSGDSQFRSWLDDLSDFRSPSGWTTRLSRSWTQHLSCLFFKLIVYCLTVGWDVTIFPLIVCHRHYLQFQSSRRRITMRWVITVITQGIPSLSPTKYYFSLEFRIGTVCSNETWVNCRPMWHFVSSFRTRPGRCEFFSSDALFSTLLLLTLCTRTIISVKQINKI